MGKTCHYCNTDMSHLHWNSKHCKSDECQDKFNTDRLKRVKEANERRNRKRPAVLQETKNVELGPYRCRYCNGRLLKDGPRMFCDNTCRDQYLGTNRSDGDWVFA